MRSSAVDVKGLLGGVSTVSELRCNGEVRTPQIRGIVLPEGRNRSEKEKKNVE